MDKTHMTWRQLYDYIIKYNETNGNTYSNVKKHLVAKIIFSNSTPAWEGEIFTEEERTYTFGNAEKYWYPNLCGSSLFASCPAETGLIRLDWYIYDWVIENCAIISEE